MCLGKRLNFNNNKTFTSFRSFETRKLFLENKYESKLNSKNYLINLAIYNLYIQISKNKVV